MEELLISRDTSSFADGVLCFLSKLAIQSERIMKSQEVLLDKIDSIARRVETLENSVKSMKPIQFEQVEMSSPSSLGLPSEEEIQGWMNSLDLTPAVTTSMDMCCYETL